MNFREVLTEGSINDKSVTKAFKIGLKGYGFGNFRFDMGDFEMSTIGGEDDDYDEEDDSATMTVLADNKESFTFKLKDKKYTLVSVKDKKTAAIILNNLATGNFKGGK